MVCNLGSNCNQQKDLLTKIRKASSKEDYENRNCGRFRRIFPCDDRARHAKYCSMLSAAFGLFLSGRGATMRKEIEVNYNNKLRVGPRALQICNAIPVSTSGDQGILAHTHTHTHLSLIHI